MDFRPIARAADAFQQSPTEGQIEAMCRRAFGSEVVIASAIELGNGMYNNTYRVDIGLDRPVILRVAPEPARQSRVEHQLMRSEHASVPFLAPLGTLIPQTLAIDFTHQVIGRDYLFQTMLEGEPAPDALGAYPRASWVSFFRQMGTIAKTIHGVRGERFGPMIGPEHASWSEAVIASFADLAADLEGAGLDVGDVREVAMAAEKHHAVLDEIVEPWLLHGDLWTVNVMISPGAAEPTICGVFDNDRTSWGDPASDWTIFMAGRKPGTERDAFWETYGAPSSTPGAVVRSLFYQARHVGAIRSERQRLGKNDAIAETYDEMRDLLERLRSV